MKVTESKINLKGKKKELLSKVHTTKTGLLHRSLCSTEAHYAHQTLHSNTIVQPCYTFMDINPSFCAGLLHRIVGQVPHLGHFFSIWYHLSGVQHHRLWQEKLHPPLSFSHNEQWRAVPTNKRPSRISWTSFFHY